MLSFRSRSVDGSGAHGGSALPRCSNWSDWRAGSGSTGIGQEIVRYSTSFRIDTVFAILLIVMFVTSLVNLAFNHVEKRLLSWQDT